MNEEYHGKDAKEFIGDRWVAQRKPAVMVSNSYLPFGLGRWACPGRFLAIAGTRCFLYQFAVNPVVMCV